MTKPDIRADAENAGVRLLPARRNALDRPILNDFMANLLRSCGLALLLTTAARAENWPQWRGPYFNGSTTETELPTQWSKTENVAWVTPLPGYSGATPVVWEESVFVSSPDEQKNLLLLCLDTEDRPSALAEGGGRGRPASRPQQHGVAFAGDRREAGLQLVCHGRSGGL